MTLIVTLDGPSGTGKSSVSREVAERAGLPHLDTGAFYRAATLAVLGAEVDPEDQEGVLEVARGISIDQGDGHTWLDGSDVSDAIRTDRVTSNVSAVSAHPEVRKLLVEHQRRWVIDRGGRAVVEGRDTGSVVFPDADLKVYLDARPEVRARRRALQTGADARRVAEMMARRDHKDSTRQASPLSVPPGARVVDTSDMTFEQVVEHLMDLISATASS